MLVSIMSGICLLGVMSFSVAAPESYSPEDVKKLIDRLEKVTQESQEMRKEMVALKSELHQLKQQVEKNQTQVVLAKSSGPTEIGPEGQVITPKAKNEKERSLLARMTSLPTVTTSPYVGLQPTYDGSDLIVNVSSMNEDLRLLRQRQVLARKLGGDLAVLEQRPVILISGKLEPTISTNQVTSDRLRQSDINLESTELDFLAEVGSNAFGFVSIGYDDQAYDAQLAGFPVGRRVANSRIFLKRGFITLGNLDKTPFYFSAGQMFTDFGRYSSNMISGTLPSKLGRINARQLNLGYVFPMGLSASAYIFRGDTAIGERDVIQRRFVPNTNQIVRFFQRRARSSEINEGGVNLRYKKAFANGSMEVGAGYISNIADADSSQVTGAGFPRRGFAFTNEVLVQRVPGFNTYGQLSLGSWNFKGEYTGATRAYSIINMDFNDQPAKPRALQLELARRFDLFNKPSLVGFSYNRSWQSLALALPEDYYAVIFSTSPLKNVRFSLEYRYSNEYKAGTTAYMAANPFNITPTNLIFRPPSDVIFRSTGGHTNSVIAQLGLYF